MTQHCRKFQVVPNAFITNEVRFIDNQRGVLQLRSSQLERGLTFNIGQTGANKKMQKWVMIWSVTRAYLWILTFDIHLAYNNPRNVQQSNVRFPFIYQIFFPYGTFNIVTQWFRFIYCIFSSTKGICLSSVFHFFCLL